MRAVSCRVSASFAQIAPPFDVVAVFNRNWLLLTVAARLTASAPPPSVEPLVALSMDRVPLTSSVV